MAYLHGTSFHAFPPQPALMWGNAGTIGRRRISPGEQAAWAVTPSPSFTSPLQSSTLKILYIIIYINKYIYIYMSIYTFHTNLQGFPSQKEHMIRYIIIIWYCNTEYLIPFGVSDQAGPKALNCFGLSWKMPCSATPSKPPSRTWFAIERRLLVLFLVNFQKAVILVCLILFLSP